MTPQVPHAAVSATRPDLAPHPQGAVEFEDQHNPASTPTSLVERGGASPAQEAAHDAIASQFSQCRPGDLFEAPEALVNDGSLADPGERPRVQTEELCLGLLMTPPSPSQDSGMSGSKGEASAAPTRILGSAERGDHNISRQLDLATAILSPGETGLAQPHTATPPLVVTCEESHGVDFPGASTSRACGAGGNAIRGPALSLPTPPPSDASLAAADPSGNASPSGPQTLRRQRAEKNTGHVSGLLVRTPSFPSQPSALSTAPAVCSPTPPTGDAEDGMGMCPVSGAQSAIEPAAEVARRCSEAGAPPSSTPAADVLRVGRQAESAGRCTESGAVPNPTPAAGVVGRCSESEAPPTTTQSAAGGSTPDEGPVIDRLNRLVVGMHGRPPVPCPGSEGPSMRAENGATGDVQTLRMSPDMCEDERCSPAPVVVPWRWLFG
jgi:hypothetical protein